MKDEKYTPEVGTWLKGREVGPRDSQDTARRVATRLPHIPQRSRWWPFPLLYRRNRSASTTDTAEHRPGPMPVTNGRTPTVIGRTQTMFSPAKAITAGALVFAIGGVMLVSQTAQQPSVVPGAEADAEAVAPAWVTGTIGLGSSCSGPTASTPSASTSEADMQPVREQHRCSTQTWTTSDPRLTGTATETWDADVYVLDEAIISVVAGTYDVRNESGGWLCHNRDGLAYGMGRYAAPASDEKVTCVGAGAYDGLTAILLLDWSNSPPSSVPLVGLIFPGEPPPLPELVAAE